MHKKKLKNIVTGVSLKVDGIYAFVARLYLAIMGFGDLLGMIWFLTYLDRISVISGWLAVISSLVASYFPREQLNGSSKTSINIVILVCFVGILSQISPLYRYFTKLDSVQVSAVMLSLLLIISFVVIILEVNSKKRDI